MSMVRRVLRIGWKAGRKNCGDPIVKLDYFVSVDGKHENDKANGTKRARADWQKPTCT